MRALAILAVILFHMKMPFVTGGFTGVDVFFVISGYLIGGHIHKDLVRGTFSFLSFYQRRAKRILPALYCVLVTLLIGSLFLLSPFEFRQLAGYVIATAASFSNILLWRKSGYFSPEVESNPLLMTWSLAVEEQFYLVIPLLMVLVSRLRHRLVLPTIAFLAGASLLLAWINLNFDPVGAFYLLPARMWELCAGVALAMFDSRARRHAEQRGALSNTVGLAGLALMLAPVFLLKPSTPFPGPAALPSVLGTMFLLASAGGWTNRKLLAAPVLTFVGQISYSWYLWHWPVLAWMRLVRGNNEMSLRLGLTGVAVSLGLALLSYYFVERPFRASRMAPKPLLFRYAIASAVLLLVAGALFRGGGMNYRYPALDSFDRAKLAFQADPCLAVTGESRPRLNAMCVDVSSAASQAAIWGDSTAAALSPAFRALASQQGYEVEEYAKTACPPLIGVARNDPQHPDHIQDCLAFNNAVLERLRARPQVKVVALQGLWLAPLVPPEQLVREGEAPLSVADSHRSTVLLEESLRKTLFLLRQAGKEVVLIGDIPRFQVDPLWRMRTERIPLRRMLQSALSNSSLSADPGSDRSRDDASAAQILKNAALSVPGVQYWSPRTQLCTDSGLCLYREGESAFYVDQNHISPAGGRKALQGLMLNSQTGAP